MNTKELVDNISKITGINKKETKIMILAVSCSMKEFLVAGKRIVLTGVGSFELVDRKERKGVNPKTLEKIIIPERKALKFKASKKLKNLIN
jgi:DNA-binding protein HU-beta